MIQDTAFGKNDIRGIYNKDITEELFFYTGRGFVQYLIKHSKLIPSMMWITVCMFIPILIFLLPDLIYRQNSQ